MKSSTPSRRFRNRALVVQTMIACLVVSVGHCWTWLAARAIGAESLSGTGWLIPGDEGGGMAMLSQTGNVVKLKANYGCGPRNLLDGTITYPASGSLNGATITGTITRCTKEDLLGCPQDPMYKLDFTAAVSEVAVLGFVAQRTIAVTYTMQIWESSKPCKKVREEKRTDTYTQTTVHAQPAPTPTPDPCPPSVPVSLGRIMDKAFSQDRKPFIPPGCEKTTLPGKIGR